jgi:putative hemolysin
MDDPSILITLLFLIILSGLFSGSESALLSLEETKMRAMKRRNIKGFIFLEKLKAKPKRLIITILIGNNLVNILIPVLATVWGTAQFGQESLGFITGALTIILLIFGEIIPKNFALSHNELFALIVSPFLYLLSRILLPIIILFEKLSDLVTPKENKKTITETEVLEMVSMGEEHGGITKEEKERITNLLNFQNTTVKEVMTPRKQINTLSENDTLKTAKKIFLDNPHSRIPVYKEDIDSIISIITFRDVFEALSKYNEDKLIKNIELKTAYIIPTTKKISSLFKEFQKQRIHIAIILDEYGGTAGIVTMEDIIEDILGDIHDETDQDSNCVEKVNNNTWTLLPTLTIEEIFESTGIWVDSNINNKNKTISLLILEKLERFPRKGEEILFNKSTFIIEKINKKNVEQIRMIIKE